MHYEVIIIGAGGAGLMCAIEAAKRGRRVLVVDHAAKVGGKILISGGGRCNFTNTGASSRQYLSENEHFCKSAMARFEPADFIALVEKHKIPYYEKKLGQLFCERSAQDIVNMLVNETREAGAFISLNTSLQGVWKEGELFSLQASTGLLTCESLVVATGGLSIPKLGATGFGYELATKFGLHLTERAPALDGFTFRPEDGARFKALSGLSADIEMRCGGQAFRENILFTHAGISGPAALQCSLHWRPGMTVEMQLLPDIRLGESLLEKKRTGQRKTLKNALSELLPARLAELLVEQFLTVERFETALADFPDKLLLDFAASLQPWVIEPQGTVGYGKAEVTRGGVSTDELSSKTLEAKKVPGLYFIGEVVDVTGWLGGYNFQWAWASGFAAGQAV